MAKSAKAKAKAKTRHRRKVHEGGPDVEEPVATPEPTEETKDVLSTENMPGAEPVPEVVPEPAPEEPGLQPDGKPLIWIPEIPSGAEPLSPPVLESRDDEIGRQEHRAINTRRPGETHSLAVTYAPSRLYHIVFDAGVGMVPVVVKDYLQENCPYILID